MIDAVVSKELPLTDDQIKILFGNLEELINVNTTLLIGLVEQMRKWDDSTRLGTVIGQLVRTCETISNL